MKDLRDFLISNTMILLIFPILFVGMGFLKDVLLEGVEFAKGEEKYKTWYQVQGASQPHSGRMSIRLIKDFLLRGIRIVDIERLKDSWWSYLSVGPQLCISALSIDATRVVVSKSQGADPYTPAIYVVLLVLSMFAFFAIVNVLKRWRKHKGVVLLTDIIGVALIYAAFIFPGG